MDPVTESERLIGQTIAGQYRITHLLGMGAMAAIYRAEQEYEPHEVALKILRPSVVRSRTAAARFHREAQSASALQHPGIIQIYGWGFDTDVPYIAMELIDGEDIYSLLEDRGRLGQEHAIRIAIQVCDALSVAHAAGIIHRDLKPENVMVIPEGRHGEDLVKVLDFGIAKLISGDNDQGIDDGVSAQVLTQTGSAVGTPSHMAPEQAGGGRIDQRADIYAIGILIYEMVTGRLPFEDESPLKVIIKQVREPPPPPSIYLPEIDQRLEEIILRTLEKAPKDRHQSARELLADLAGVLLTLSDTEVDTTTAGNGTSPVELAMRVGARATVTEITQVAEAANYEFEDVYTAEVDTQPSPTKKRKRASLRKVLLAALVEDDETGMPSDQSIPDSLDEASTHLSDSGSQDTLDVPTRDDPHAYSGRESSAWSSRGGHRPIEIRVGQEETDPHVATVVSHSDELQKVIRALSAQAPAGSGHAYDGADVPSVVAEPDVLARVGPLPAQVLPALETPRASERHDADRPIATVVMDSALVAQAIAAADVSGVVPTLVSEPDIDDEQIPTIVAHSDDLARAIAAITDNDPASAPVSPGPAHGVAQPAAPSSNPEQRSAPGQPSAPGRRPLPPRRTPRPPTLPLSGPGEQAAAPPMEASHAQYDSHRASRGQVGLAPISPLAQTRTQLGMASGLHSGQNALLPHADALDDDDDDDDVATLLADSPLGPGAFPGLSLSGKPLSSQVRAPLPSDSMAQPPPFSNVPPLSGGAMASPVSAAPISPTGMLPISQQPRSFPLPLSSGPAAQALNSGDFASRSGMPGQLPHVPSGVHPSSGAYPGSGAHSGSLGSGDHLRPTQASAALELENLLKQMPRGGASAKTILFGGLVLALIAVLTLVVWWWWSSSGGVL